MLAGGLPGLARRFARLVRRVASRFMGLVRGVARFDGGLTRFAIFAL